MQRVWQIQEAKNKLSEVVDEALKSGPQLITRRGEGVVIVMALSDYQRLAAREQKLTDFFRASPLVGVDLDLSRDSGGARPDLEL